MRKDLSGIPDLLEMWPTYIQEARAAKEQKQRSVQAMRNAYTPHIAVQKEAVEHLESVWKGAAIYQRANDE